MITSLRVKNFRAIEDITVPLGPFNVLIGPNDTGKSSFLEAAYALATSIREPWRNCFWTPWHDQELVHNYSPKEPVMFSSAAAAIPSIHEHIDGLQRDIQYTLTIRFAHGKVQVLEETLESGIHKFAFQKQRTNETNIQIYPSDNAVAGGIRGPAHEMCEMLFQRVRPAFVARWDLEQMTRVGRTTGNRASPFDVTGFGLSSYLAQLKLLNSDRFNTIRDQFCRIFPAFSDIAFVRADGPEVERNERFEIVKKRENVDCYPMTLMRKDGVGIPGASVSGGALFTLAFLALAHLAEPIRLLLIEEPENGLHPKLLEDVVCCLRNAITEVDGTQVILTTHSPLLVDYAQPYEVRVFLRDDSGRVQAYNLADVPDMTSRLKYIMLGELVYNEGEANLVKEIPENANTCSR